MLIKLESKKALGFNINRRRWNGKELLPKVQPNQASFNVGCKNKYNNPMLENEQQKETK